MKSSACLLLLLAAALAHGSEVEPNSEADAQPAPVAATDANRGSASNAYCRLTCTDEVDAICGTDGMSYINQCHLLQAKCYNPTLEKASDGLCVVPTGPPSSAGASSSTTPPPPTSQRQRALFSEVNEFEQDDAPSLRQCNSMCDKTYQPVCGSNGVTYANDCLLDYASCVNSRIVKLSDGRCAGSVSDRRRSPGGQSTTACIPSPCPSTDTWVCGSDGQSYLNACLLGNARCLNPGLNVLHEGPCNAQDKFTCDVLTCRPHQKCEPIVETESAHCVDQCVAEHCTEDETCEMLEPEECFSAPCTLVPTCVSKSGDALAPEATA
ncbi:hypothetical protein P43SY_006943 [Pythium insidiosum]|uniref:Kazal-like domain-containing protein n=1 Tax=Pythium insidiosum TaxID=114742 RepID=A0AAD5Q8K2_PYTIN|nr:hypothetical protein P43SY_006943 [Pythium insidiosum]